MPAATTPDPRAPAGGVEVPAPARSTSGDGTSSRGSRRREALVAAGVELLGEGGWSAITTRAVARRSGSNPGLVHYYWGGLSGLKDDIARQAVAEAFEPVLQVLMASSSWQEGLSTVVRLGQEQDEAQVRRDAELVAAALRDRMVADLMRAALTDARARVSGWMERSGVAEPAGTATLVLAALDGLLLHRLVDPGLPLGAAADAATHLAGPPDRQP